MKTLAKMTRKELLTKFDQLTMDNHIARVCPEHDGDKVCKKECCPTGAYCHKSNTKTAAVLREKALRFESTAALKTSLEENIRKATNDLKNLQQVLLSTTELISMKRQKIIALRGDIEKNKALLKSRPPP